MKALLSKSTTSVLESVSSIKDMNKELFKDQDKDKDLSSKDKDKDFSSKDKDKDFSSKDKDKDCILVLKESLTTRTRTRTNIIDIYIVLCVLSSK